jgi:hypothetical protein
MPELTLSSQSGTMNMATGEVCGTAGKTLNLAFTLFLDDFRNGQFYS